MPTDVAALASDSTSLSIEDAAAKLTAGFLSHTGDQEDSETSEAEEGEAAADETEESSEAETVEDESADEEQTPDPESQTEEEVAEDTEPTAKHKVRVDGKELEVGYDELLAGYSRTQDYTRKSQANAETRRVLETEQAAIRERRTKMDEGLKQIEDSLAVMMPKEPDWEKLRQEDPAGYPAVYTDWQRYQGQLASVKAARGQLAEEAAQEAVAKATDHAKAEFEKLVVAVPEWKDQNRRKSDFTKIVETAQSYGFTPEELSAVADHRVGLLLRDAMLYRELKSKAAEGKKKLDKVTRGVRPAAPGNARVPSKPTKAFQAARARLAETGRVSDAAAALLPFLTGGK